MIIILNKQERSWDEGNPPRTHSIVIPIQSKSNQNLKTTLEISIRALIFPHTWAQIPHNCLCSHQ